MTQVKARIDREQLGEDEEAETVVQAALEDGSEASHGEGAAAPGKAKKKKKKKAKKKAAADLLDLDMDNDDAS